MDAPTPDITLLRQNPSIALAYLTWHRTAGPTLHIHIIDTPGHHALHLPAELQGLPVEYHLTEPIRSLTCPPCYKTLASDHTRCQDEPIQLGTQIQPRGAGWVGTAGAPVRWIDKQGTTRWGILSNWHVFASGVYHAGHPQHQPDDQRPACATLTDFEPVCLSCTNLIDAAIADAKIDGKHTISDRLLGLGKIGTVAGQIWYRSRGVTRVLVHFPAEVYPHDWVSVPIDNLREITDSERLLLT